MPLAENGAKFLQILPILIFFNFNVVKFSNWLINLKFNADAFLVGSTFYYLVTKKASGLRLEKFISQVLNSC